MRLSVEEAACQILQTVQRQLPQASVEHESLGGTHYFYIDRAGARFSVRYFPREHCRGSKKLSYRLQSTRS